jgi:hypothetical protein
MYMGFSNQHIKLRNPLIREEGLINITVIREAEWTEYYLGQRFARESSFETEQQDVLVTAVDSLGHEELTNH